MPICIVAATASELQHLSPAFLQNHPAVITGVGAVNTTFHLTRAIEQMRPSFLIQAGIAGSFENQFHPGEAVVVSHDRFGDLGVLENNQWKDIFDMGLAPVSQFPFTDGWLINPDPGLLKATGLPAVHSITVNTINTNPETITRLTSRYHPAIESMEGAAFHFVCLHYKVPFIQLRTISNYIGERDKTKWDMQKALSVLAEQVEKISLLLR